MYVQDYEATDQLDRPEDERTKGMVLLYAHHSLCDGVSIICMALALSDEYGREYFVPGKDAQWW